MVKEQMAISARILGPLYGGNFNSDNAGALPFVLPGEEVEVADGEVLVAHPSPDRVAAGCAHFGLCGGCQYQHADHAVQLALKGEILRGLLTGLADLPKIGAHSAEEWHYRNRIRMRVERVADGEFRVGYSRRASNEFLPIRMCPIASPLLWRAAEALLALAGRWLPAIAEAEFFSTADESRLQLTLFLRTPEPALHAAAFASLCGRLQAAIPELAGAGAELDPELNRRWRRRWEPLAWGSPGLNYDVAGRAYWVSRGAFFQVNRFLIDRLVALVCAGQSGTLAWDLFAGVGLFTRALAESFDRVIAVEAGAAAAADLRIVGKRTPAIEAVHSATLDFLRAWELRRERPELIVLDPSRAGLGVEAATVLARINVPRIVYVSCDPVTLARDLAILTRGYRIERLNLVDLFPQTFHMETVVHLGRR
jgi:23S rRNA (uracil1939-C5)-methyltransferase